MSLVYFLPMQELKKQIVDLKDRLEAFSENLDLPQKRKKVEVLELESMDSNLWDDQERARKLLTELGDLKNEIDEFDRIYSEVKTLYEMAEEDMLSGELEKDVQRLLRDFGKIELRTYLSGKYDRRNAIVSIHAGQGGTEAMDWTHMLFRMYLRYCERKNWPVEVLDQTVGDEAGIKSVTFKVVGSYAYGYLKGESGTHRLVRQSPFNADRLRQTSFALVEVLPEIEEVDEPDIEIKEEDLEWQFFRSGGHGGQNVNKVSTAVRLIHKPTNISVSAQTERFQEQNRKIALNLLRSKLWAIAQEEMKKEEKNIKGDYKPATWGTQIRSYVLHPYKMVKDLRTNVETGNTDAILDGDLDEFIEAELKI